MNLEIYENTLPQDTFFIHGNIASNRWWYPTRDIFQQQKDRKTGRMILAEFCGHGQSANPTSRDDLNMHKLAERFVKEIENRKFKNLNLIGHSAGGFIALLMLSLAPQHFRRAVLLDSVGVKGLDVSESALQGFALMQKNPSLMRHIVSSTIYQNHVQDDFFNEVILTDALRAAQAVGTFVFENLNHQDISQEVRKIQHPCLVLHGEFDKTLPPEGSRVLAEMLPQGKFLLLNDQGHSANLENPRKFAEIISKFLFS